MNSNPQRALFTIVTVSYNCCSLIEKTIKSVLQQDYHDTEYIIIYIFRSIPVHFPAAY